jgi:endoglucanase
MDNWYGTSNSVALLGIKDPKDNYVIEIHQYFDSDFSGTSPNCKDEDIGRKSLEPVTRWLRKNNLKGFLAEFGASTQSKCMDAMDNTLKHMEENFDVWFG